MKGPGGSKQCSILNVYELWPSLSLSGQKRLLVLDPPLIPSRRICLLPCAPAASRLRSSRFTCRATHRRGAALRCLTSPHPLAGFPSPTRVCSADSADGGADSSAVHSPVTQALLCCPCPSAQGHQTSPRAASEPVTPQQQCAWTVSVLLFWRPRFEKMSLQTWKRFFSFFMTNNNVIQCTFAVSVTCAWFKQCFNLPPHC